MERLSQLIETFCLAGRWKAFPITRGGTRLSHLMFADDVVLFGEASREQAQLIRDCLDEFCSASGQRVSMQKSNIYFSPNTNEAVVAEVCNILSMKQTDNLGRYLGVPTIHGRVTKNLFQNVVTRVDNRLAGWKTKCLSLAGRITLIKSTITAIPAYVMQSARLPRSVCDELDKKIRRFLWGGTALERKPHLVAWGKVIQEKAHGGLGIRSMRQLNTAFLMKLNWRLKTQPHTLWARILQEKYCRRQDLERLPDRRVSNSNVWRGIMDTIELTSKGMGMAIGDGRLTNFWTHKWLDGQQLLDHALSQIPEQHYPLRVCDYWLPGSGWDWPRLSQLLPSDILRRIASFELPMEAIDDQPIWVGSKSGDFRINSAIQLVQSVVDARLDHLATTTSTTWSWVWKLRLPYRVQVFVWLVLHRKLLTNLERYKRHLTSTATCELCLANDEDLDHVLRRCLHAQDVWGVLAQMGMQSVDVDTDLPEWLQLNLRGAHIDPSWPTKFAVALWYIWKWRCVKIFGSIEQLPMDIGDFLSRKFQETLRVLKKDIGPKHTSHTMSTPHMVKWEAPPRGWRMLNTDGAARGTMGLAGAGGVLRDETGTWLIGFSEFLGHCSATMAELRAVLRGLQIAKEVATTKLWVQVDSTVIISMLSKDTQCHPAYHSLIKQCKLLIDWAGWVVKISHCFREANQVADKLANLGVESQLGVKKYRAPPEETREALYADNLGVLWPRGFNR